MGTEEFCSDECYEAYTLEEEEFREGDRKYHEMVDRLQDEIKHGDREGEWKDQQK